MIYSDEKIRENIAANEASEIAYAKWYSKLPDEKKATIFKSGFDLVANQVRREVRKTNLFCTKYDEILRFVELVHRSKIEESTYEFVKEKLIEKSEMEWQKRFKTMKKKMNWSYEDIANFVGASSADSIKSSVNRKLPAFAKLAVCIFEQMEKEV
ncbi:MAG: hypothetical protein AAGG68_26015 [Bacteroidota bacterium]